MYLQTTLGAHLAFRPVFYREHAARSYSAAAHGLALLLANAPHLLATSVLFSSLVYWLTPLRPFAASWAFFSLACVISAAFFAAMAAAFAALLPSPQVAQVLGGVSISILVLFAGLFVTPQRVPAGWIGLYYADPLSHILRALAANEVGSADRERILAAAPNALTPCSRALSQFWCVGLDCPQINVPGVGSMGQWAYAQQFLAISAANE